MVVPTRVPANWMRVSGWVTAASVARSEPVPESLMFATVRMGPRSTAPRSQAEPTLRGKPRWSVAKGETPPASRAGEPKSGASVQVMPPPGPSGRSLGSSRAPVVPTSAPVGKVDVTLPPPAPPLEPRRLGLPLVWIVPEDAKRSGELVSVAVLPASKQRFSARVPEMNTPPPVAPPAVEPPEFAKTVQWFIVITALSSVTAPVEPPPVPRLPVKVQAERKELPAPLRKSAPESTAVLRSKVQPVALMEQFAPTSDQIAPPKFVATLSVKVQSVRKSWPPLFAMAPPFAPVPWTRRRRLRLSAEVASSTKMRPTSPPEMVMPWASAEASIVIVEPAAATLIWEASVMVCPLSAAAKVMVSEPALALASRTAWRSEPAPESAAVVTVKAAAAAEPAKASAARNAGSRRARRRGEGEGGSMGGRNALC